MSYRRGDPLIKRTPLVLAASGALMGLVSALGFLFVRIRYAYALKGRENLKALGRRPVFFVCNHSLPLDCVIHGVSLLPRFSYFTVIEATFLAPVVGGLVRLLGGIPIPADPRRLADLDEAMDQALAGRGAVCFYAEGECFLQNQEIRPLKAGPFYYSIVKDVPILPVVSVLRKKGRRLGVEVHLLPAIYPPPAIGERGADLHAAHRFAQEVRATMQAVIDAEGGDKSLYRGPMPRIRGINDGEERKKKV